MTEETHDDTEQDDSEACRIRIWYGHDADTDAEPDELIPVEPETTHIWRDDPRYHSPPLNIEIHPEDRPATLKIFTSDSVRDPPGYDDHIERGYWDGPMGQGIHFGRDHDLPPFGCEVWGRVMFFVEPGEN